MRDKTIKPNFLIRIFPKKFRYTFSNFLYTNRFIDISFFLKYPWTFDSWFIHPFNSQIKRTQFISNLLTLTKPDLVIETGTHIGTTTIFFSSYATKVISIESNNDFHKSAFERLNRLNLKNVELIYGESHIVIPQLLKKITLKTNNILVAYLDAHWSDYLPLKNELESFNLLEHPYILLIDDFKVPNDDGYFYDTYAGLDIDINLITPKNDLKIFTLKIHSLEETGAKRGLGIVINKKALDLLPKGILDEIREINHN